MSFQSDDNNLDFHVHYIGVDVALRRGLVLGFMPAFRRKLIEDGQSFGSPWGVSERKKERAALNKKGADGRITELAASVLASGRVDPKQVLADLSCAYHTTVEIQTRAAPIFATFYWADGTISVELIGHGSLDWAGNQLDLYGIELPETKLVAMAGRPISDLADLPFGGDILVERIVPIDNGVRFHLSDKTFLIEFASGKTWECPKGLL